MNFAGARANFCWNLRFSLYNLDWRLRRFLPASWTFSALPNTTYVKLSLCRSTLLPANSFTKHLHLCFFLRKPIRNRIVHLKQQCQTGIQREAEIIHLPDFQFNICFSRLLSHPQNHHPPIRRGHATRSRNPRSPHPTLQSRQPGPLRRGVAQGPGDEGSSKRPGPNRRIRTRDERGRYAETDDSIGRGALRGG